LRNFLGEPCDALISDRLRKPVVSAFSDTDPAALRAEKNFRMMRMAAKAQRAEAREVQAGRTSKLSSDAFGHEKLIGFELIIVTSGNYAKGRSANKKRRLRVIVIRCWGFPHFRGPFFANISGRQQPRELLDRQSLCHQKVVEARKNRVVHDSCVPTACFS